MSDLNPYEESLAIDLAKANDGIKQLQQALKDQSSVSDRLAEVNEKLTAERDEHWKSFVHWRKEADVLTEQLELLATTNEQLVAINEAARADAKEAEAYAEELKRDLKTCRMAQVVMDNTVAELEKQCEGLMQAGMNNGQALILAEAKLAECLERKALLEARLGKAVELAKEAIETMASGPFFPDEEEQRLLSKLAEIEGERL
jgi:DNA repair exonuclease SbcCD ATPase subunit